MSKKKIIQKIILPCVFLILVLVAIFSGLRILESTVLSGERVPSETISSKTIVRNNIEYFPRQDITVVMVLGVDQFGPVQSSEYHKNSGSADMVMLLIFDEQSRECSVLHLNRDTMLDMPVLGIRGEYAGTYYGQLALAHTYGSGMEDSSENVKNALESYLHGVTVDYYVTMRMDAIPILNDAVGGVTVTVVDDFSKVNPSITKGEITLQGDQAIDFVRTRKDVGDQKNTARMDRQKEYIENFLKALSQKEKEDVHFVANVYDQVASYIVTDCSVETLNNMLNQYADFPIREVVSPVGESLVKDGYYEFHADEEALDALIVDLFYRPK